MMRRAKVLAADVGGTKTLVGVFGPAGELLGKEQYPSTAFPGLEPLLEAFLEAQGISGAGLLDAACLAVAGPVSDGEARLTNLPWAVRTEELAARLGIAKVALVNDFEAVAAGIQELEPQDCRVLQQGIAQPRGVRAVLGAGTGLGAGWLAWQEGEYVCYPSEGSHGDFAPADALQAELWRVLQGRYGHVSWERVVSGPGLADIYRFLAERAGSAARASDPESISARALAGNDPLAEQALDVFVSAYGAFAGNWALATLPRGGLYVAGGIAGKIAPKLAQGAFMAAFRDKGRYAALLETIPVRVVLRPDVGLWGAARLGRRLRMRDNAKKAE